MWRSCKASAKCSKASEPEEANDPPNAAWPSDDRRLLDRDGAARTAPPPPADPLVKENTTIKVAAHTHVILMATSDWCRTSGSARATLVIEPDSVTKRRDGAARSCESEQQHRILRGVDALSRRAHHLHRGISSFGQIRQLHRDDEQASSGAAPIKTFSGRSPLTAEP
jgi:hypothetical protein